MLASNKSSIIGDEVVIAQRLVNGAATTLDLDNYGIAVGREGSFDIQLNCLGRSYANREAVGGSELGCIVRVLRSSSRKIADEDRAMGW